MEQPGAAAGPAQGQAAGGDDRRPRRRAPLDEAGRAAERQRKSEQRRRKRQRLAIERRQAAEAQGQAMQSGSLGSGMIATLRAARQIRVDRANPQLDPVFWLMRGYQLARRAAPTQGRGRAARGRGGRGNRGRQNGHQARQGSQERIVAQEIAPQGDAQGDNVRQEADMANPEANAAPQEADMADQPPEEIRAEARPVNPLFDPARVRWY